MLRTQLGAAHGFLRNLVKASGLPASEARHLLGSRHSFTKFTFATRKTHERRPFLDSKKIWCMNLEYVDKLAKNNNGVRYIPVPQELFDRTKYAKGIKT